MFIDQVWGGKNNRTDVDRTLFGFLCDICSSLFLMHNVVVRTAGRQDVRGISRYASGLKACERMVLIVFCS
jgi:hypothetical protein